MKEKQTGGLFLSLKKLQCLIAPCQYASYAQMALGFDGLTLLPLDSTVRALPLADLVLPVRLVLLEYVFLATCI